VFPAKQGWVTVLAAGSMFEPNQSLLAANEGTLLHYVNAEDHGWSFTVFRAAEPVSGFAADWEDDDDPYNDVNLDAGLVCEIARQAYGADKDPAALEALLKPEDPFEWIETGGMQSASQFAQFVGLTHYDWLSYDYYASNNDPAEGVVTVE
jgi:hypothetical protein